MKKNQSNDLEMEMLHYPRRDQVRIEVVSPLVHDPLTLPPKKKEASILRNRKQKQIRSSNRSIRKSNIVRNSRTSFRFVDDESSMLDNSSTGSFSNQVFDRFSSLVDNADYISSNEEEGSVFTVPPKPKTRIFWQRFSYQFFIHSTVPFGPIIHWLVCGKNGVKNQFYNTGELVGFILAYAPLINYLVNVETFTDIGYKNAFQDAIPSFFFFLIHKCMISYKYALMSDESYEKILYSPRCGFESKEFIFENIMVSWAKIPSIIFRECLEASLQKNGLSTQDGESSDEFFVDFASPITEISHDDSIEIFRTKNIVNRLLLMHTFKAGLVEKNECFTLLEKDSFMDPVAKDELQNSPIIENKISLTAFISILMQRGHYNAGKGIFMVKAIVRFLSILTACTSVVHQLIYFSQIYSNDNISPLMIFQITVGDIFSFISTEIWAWRIYTLLSIAIIDAMRRFHGLELLSVLLYVEKSSEKDTKSNAFQALYGKAVTIIQSKITERVIKEWKGKNDIVIGFYNALFPSALSSDNAINNFSSSSSSSISHDPKQNLPAQFSFTEEEVMLLHEVFNLSANENVACLPFTDPANIQAWLAARRVIIDFGINYQRRTHDYLGFIIFLDLIMLIISVFLIQFSDLNIEEQGGVLSLMSISLSFSVLVLFFMLIGATSNFYLQHHIFGILSKYHELWLSWIDYTQTSPLSISISSISSSKTNNNGSSTSKYGSWRNGKYKEKMNGLLSNVNENLELIQNDCLDILKAASEFLTSEKGNTPFSLYKVELDYNLLFQILTLFFSYISFIFSQVTSRIEAEINAETQGGQAP